MPTDREFLIAKRDNLREKLKASEAWWNGLEPWEREQLEQYEADLNDPKWQEKERQNILASEGFAEREQLLMEINRASSVRDLPHFKQ